MRTDALRVPFGFLAPGILLANQVICAGDLKYELDDTGVHKCTWSPGSQGLVGQLCHIPLL